ncbi:alkaline phosphatase D family protein [Polyangium jinanense]|uniref:Alkaline phosphatase D family protein n=1 Tax=Polyangium jinanense TaxID=2829994 RepID=A0A9X3X3F4_9BACT|nr:alkaline phosphatase D family protein [Polyangium jinanense]MDC3955267.1 alkaline phosphatase D family protein [Polyangium jinanense]MDC3981568.1 alkaline phosphatase D family protein [Polyangium jinanense]
MDPSKRARAWGRRSGMKAMLIAAGLVSACGGSQPSTPKDAVTLEGMYRLQWNEMPKQGEDLNRELFQLAFPTPTSVAAWHLYPKGADPAWFQDVYTIWLKTKTGPTLVEVTPSRTKGPHNTERIEFRGLRPETEYEIRKNGVVVLTARTRPEDTTATEKLSFLAFSCNNPYAVSFKGASAVGSPEWMQQMRIKQNSLRLLAARANGLLRIKGFERPDFALGLGDQIYVDGDNKMGDATAIFQGDRSVPAFSAAESYGDLLDVIYRAHFAMTPFDRALQGVPAALIWDDHELQDGWGTKDNELPPGFKGYFESALDAFRGFQDLRNPSPHGPHRRGEATMDVEFTWGKGVRVLMLDTRSAELPVKYGKDRSAYGLWQKQLRKVEDWLRSASVDAPTLFVLGLATPLTVASGVSADQEAFAETAGCGDDRVLSNPEQCDDLHDLWAYKKAARSDLLQRLTQHFVPNRKHRLLILSGDVHYSAVHYLSTGEESCWHKGKGACGQGPLPGDFSSWKQEQACRNPPQGFSSVPEDGKEDILWGWEVISSGLTNDALTVHESAIKSLVKRDLIQVGDPRAENGDSLVSVWPRGGIYGSPSFAEVQVNKTGEMFDVGVVFYPSADEDRLINDALMLERPCHEWETSDYKFYEGSQRKGEVADGCPQAKKITRVPLDWNCIPDVNVSWTGSSYNWVKGCSDILGRKPPNDSQRSQ